MARVVVNSTPVDGPAFLALSDKAFRLWVCAVCWQSKQGTDGWVNLSVARLYVGRAARRCVRELVDAELWLPLAADEYVIARDVRGFEVWRPGPGDRTRDPISDDLRQAIYERDGRRCLACGSTERLSLDHVVHWSAGGRDTADNLRTLCKSCNSSRGTKSDVEWRGADL